MPLQPRFARCAQRIRGSVEAPRFRGARKPSRRQPAKAATPRPHAALCGTAIQTGVVMVVYLEEAVARNRAALGENFRRADLIAAIKDGARLRLRPKVMTVATIVASLMPIMWSARTGAEVMKPLATPVIGGMVSSLLHILIVTPVIFAWLLERELPRVSSDPSDPSDCVRLRPTRPTTTR